MKHCNLNVIIGVIGRSGGRKYILRNNAKIFLYLIKTIAYGWNKLGEPHVGLTKQNQHTS